MPRPPRPWFRFYSETLDSLKFHEIPDRLVKPWLRLLCLANINPKRGYLPDERKIAFALRIKEDRVPALLSEMVNLRLIDSDGVCYVMHDWEDWQYESDANLTPGRKTRAHETHNSPLRNAVGTRNERAIPAVGTPLRVAETETETETETDQRQRQRQRQNDPVSVVCSSFAKWGKVTGGTVQAIEEDVTDFSLEWVEKAERQGRNAGFDDKPPWGYCHAILERWQSQGGPDEPKQSTQGTNGYRRNTPAADEYAEFAARLRSPG